MSQDFRTIWEHWEYDGICLKVFKRSAHGWIELLTWWRLFSSTITKPDSHHCSTWLWKSWPGMKMLKRGMTKLFPFMGTRTSNQPRFRISQSSIKTQKLFACLKIVYPKIPWFFSFSLPWSGSHVSYHFWVSRYRGQSLSIAQLPLGDPAEDLKIWMLKCFGPIESLLARPGWAIHK